MPAQTEHSSPQSVGRSPGVSVTRVLVVDDDDDVRAALRKTLVTAGFEVEEAADGAAALALHEASPADVLIVDIYMPGMDGLEAMVRLMVEHPGVKIVAISGGGFRDGAEVLKIAGQLGAARTITKPFTPAELITAVREALGT